MVISEIQTNDYHNAVYANQLLITILREILLLRNKKKKKLRFHTIITLH